MLKRINNFINARESINGDKQKIILIDINGYQRKRLQKVILQMYKDILEVCNQYDITPYLIGGSALGTVRHKGFIPWDDDIDIGMTREDYNKFLKAFEAEMDDKYVISAPNYSDVPKARFTKILKKGTICREITDKEDSINGIFLDIFVIENIPKNPLARNIRGMFCNFLQFISSQVYLFENDNEMIEELYSQAGKANYKIRMIIGKIFSFRSSARWFDSVDKSAQYKKTGLYGIPTGRKHYFGEIFNGDVLFPARYMKFENIDVPLFNDTDTYLTNLYSNYMTIPPENKREHHYVVELKF